MHFDLHFVAFSAYFSKRYRCIELNHWVGAIVFARWCSVFVLMLLLLLTFGHNISHQQLIFCWQLGCSQLPGAISPGCQEQITVD